MTAAAVLLTLASLILGEATQIGPFQVRRASLFGFEVAGPTRAHVLELDEAALLLTRAARLAEVGEGETEYMAPEHQDLLIAPHETFPGHRAETWRRGPAAERRERQLRRALGRSVNRESGRFIQKLSSEPGADRVTIDTVELTYAWSSSVPAIGGDERRGE